MIFLTELKEFSDINLIEKFICLMFVITIFVFCFWQEWGEKRQQKKMIQNYILDKKTPVMSN
jgi:hypothetical protein